jgi:hypothetical protein
MITQNRNYHAAQIIERFRQSLKYKKHSHCCSPDDWKESRVSEVVMLLSTESFKNNQSAKDLRKPFLQELKVNGWSPGLKLSHSSGITITAIKSNMGLCFQTGNMGRFYADLIKLQYLYSKHAISAAVYILPTKILAKSIGSNLAYFERMVKELDIFADIITVPLFVIGLELEDT